MRTTRDRASDSERERRTSNDRCSQRRSTHSSLVARASLVTRHSSSSFVLGLYLHIPFCAHICNYCNFNRGLFDEGLKRQYVAALEQEIRAAGDGADGRHYLLRRRHAVAPRTRGGRASCSAPAASRSTSRPAPEMTLEANPETVSAAKMRGYRNAGVNRISLGVQSLHDRELATARSPAQRRSCAAGARRCPRGGRRQHQPRSDAVAAAAAAEASGRRQSKD